MNIITYKNEDIKQEITLNEDTRIDIINATGNLTINTSKNIKIFKYIKNSNIEVTYNLENNLTIDIFSINTSIKNEVNLNKEYINIDYYYSCINEEDNSYKIDINHNKGNTTSKVTSHGLNMKDKKLDFIVNGIINKDSKKCVCNQDSIIIVLDSNNCKIEPNLIVNNNDVEANHSAYIGYFDKKKIFYLNSRGINTMDAKKLLAKAFLTSNRDTNEEINELITTNINSYWR